MEGWKSGLSIYSLCVPLRFRIFKIIFKFAVWLKIK